MHVQCWKYVNKSTKKEEKTKNRTVRSETFNVSCNKKLVCFHIFNTSISHEDL